MKIRLLIIFIGLAVIFGQGCGKISAVDFASQLPGSDDEGSLNPPPEEGPGAIQLSFVQPTNPQIATATMTIEIAATPMDQLHGIRLLINGSLVRTFTRLPFSYSLNTEAHPGDTILVRAESEDLAGQLNFSELTLRRAPTVTTTTVPGADPFENSRNAGVIENNCMTNNTYDACIFWKNPVAQKGSAFPSVLRFGNDLSALQTFGVKLTGLADPSSLRNSSFRVTASSGTPVQLQNGKFKKAFAEDQSSHATAQLMAYFWLNYQNSSSQARTGLFYAKNKNIPIDAYNTSVPNNAYWDGSQMEIVMGVKTDSGSSAHEMALSAEVLLHEMGHANLQYAAGGFQAIYPSSSTTSCSEQQGTCYCLSAQGCIGAINEGQADFHYLTVFKDSPALAETIANNISGWSSRNVNNNANVSVTTRFSQSNGQIHSMGSIYASILWSIYTHPTVDKKEFEKIFMSHLPSLSGSSRFGDSREALIAQDEILFNGKYQTVIENAFQSRGVSP